MLIAIDIGNTTCNVGVFEGHRLRGHRAIATQPRRAPDEVRRHLRALANTRRLRLTRATQILICSVVPRKTSALMQALQSLGEIPIRLVGRDIIVPLMNRYTYPDQVGQDRLVGAYAAWRTYRRDCVVADFGTAITIDVVTRRGEYLGGVIAPGLDISLEALATRTALLPKIELREPPGPLGRDTANSIRAGLVFGCAALCDGLVRELKKRHVPGAIVVGTGGSIGLIAKYTKTLQYIRPHLVLEGLASLAAENTGKNVTH